MFMYIMTYLWNR